MANYKTANPMTFGLAMAAGTGVVLMIMAPAIGVVQGAAANGNAIGGMFAIGLVLLVAGVAGYLAVIQPFRAFDDINEPAEDDHGHGHADDAHADDAHGAIVITTPHDVEPRGAAH